jgi:hypothetical protein
VPGQSVGGLGDQHDHGKVVEEFDRADRALAHGLAFMARSTHPDLPGANHRVIAQFVAHGFAGAIKAWLSDRSVTKTDLVEAAVACAPAWWS